MGWKLKAEAWVLNAVMITTFFVWSWGQDWVREEDWTRNGKMLFALAGIAVMAAVYTCKRFHWTAGLFLGFTLLRWVSLRLAPVSMVEVVMVTACVFAAVFVHRFDRKNLLGNCLAIDVFLQASLGLVEVAGYFPFLEISRAMQQFVWPPIAAHGNPTILGPYLAVGLAFIPGSIFPRPVKFFAAAVVLACIACTQSTMTWGTLLVVALVAVGFYRGTRAMLAGVALTAAVGAVVLSFYPRIASTSGRLPHWGMAWENVTPFGHGPGTWKPIQIQLIQNEWKAYEEAVAAGLTPPQPASIFFAQVHNDWLQGLFEWGWVGMAPAFLALIVLFTITLKAILLRRRELFPYAALVFGLGANAGGNFILHTMPAGALMAIGAIYLFRHDFEADAIRAYYEAAERNL